MSNAPSAHDAFAEHLASAPARLPEDPLLEHGAITLLHRTALSAGLVESRSALLAGINRAFVAGLPFATNGRDGLLLDLDEMNRTGRLADGTLPLRTWLANAATLAGPRVEAEVFQRALDAITMPARTRGEVAARVVRCVWRLVSFARSCRAHVDGGRG